MTIRRVARFATALGLAAFTTGAVHAQSLNVVLNPIPQAYTNTCQSYSLGFAMARAGVPGYQLNTLGDIRIVEGQVRAAIEAEAKKLKKTPYDQVVWISAVKVLTSDTYVLNQKFYASGEDFMKDIAALTKVDAAGTLGTVLAVSLSQTPVMTSFKKIGTNSYSTGHIVTVLGIDKPTGGNSSQVPGLLLLNSAVKKSGDNNSAPQDYAPVCNSPQLPGDLKYRGAVTLEKSYQLNTYPEKFVALWITKK